MNNSGIWLAVGGVIVLGAIGVGLERGGTIAGSPPQAIKSVSRSGAIVWSHGRDGSQANAEEHWQKHGGEFPEDHSETDYVREANAFVHRPPPGTLIKHDRRGDTLFYQPSRDIFAVMDARGEPRTFFRPEDGLAYWSRQ